MYILSILPTSVSGFDWDDGNREKCEKHGVSVSEIEDLFSGPVMILPDEARSLVETRFRTVGQGRRGRHIFLVFTVREAGGEFFIRPISARYMHRKEIEHFEKENPDL